MSLQIVQYAKVKQVLVELLEILSRAIALHVNTMNDDLDSYQIIGWFITVSIFINAIAL